jgi:hypothetical protein
MSDWTAKRGADGAAVACTAEQTVLGEGVRWDARRGELLRVDILVVPQSAPSDGHGETADRPKRQQCQGLSRPTDPLGDPPIAPTVQRIRRLEDES